MNVLSAGLRRRTWSSLAALLLVAATAHATTVVPPEFDQLVNETDYVVRAVVKSVKSEYRNGPDGRTIVSFVELEVRETILGTPPAHVVLEMLGGQIGDHELEVVGAPKFKTGDEDILFVSGNGRTISPLFAMMHGRYPVLREPGTGRRYIARSNLEPLAATADVARPIEPASVTSPQPLAAGTAAALTPEQFAAQIKAAVNPNYLRARLH
ncbi:MAG: hypothetical protein HY302_04275 [Opitutae bacterium]|nr:hypothetical protein [Opitutae bacterium]